MTADVAIRFDEVEHLVNQYKDFLTDAEKNKTCTLGAELGNIREGRPMRWTLNNLEDIDSIAGSILKAFETIGLPYLDTYSSMERTYEALIGDDRSAWLHSPFHDERALRAIALAFLVREPESFSRTAAAKFEFLANKKE